VEAPDELRGAGQFRLRIAGADEILSAHGQPTEIFFETTKCSERLREKQAVARFVDVEAFISHASNCLTHAQQHGVSIKRTVFDEMACHRIDRIAPVSAKIEPRQGAGTITGFS